MMNKLQAEQKAVETAKLNNRPFKVVPVTYLNGESGWDVSPVSQSKSAQHGRSQVLPEKRAYGKPQVGR